MSVPKERKIKRVPKTMFDEPFEVTLIDVGTEYSVEYKVEFEGEEIGYIHPHSTQSERKISGSRLVSRGPTFTAWAQRGMDIPGKPHHQQPRYDYYAQHRSQAEAIRRLVDEHKRSKRP